MQRKLALVILALLVALPMLAQDMTVDQVIAKHIEMGQGTYTGLPTLVAEELDADWTQIRVEGAPADAGRYNNLFWGPAQGTGGSTAIANSYEQLRKAGAAARAMLVAAAAQRWNVSPDSITGWRWRTAMSWRIQVSSEAGSWRWFSTFTVS